jgi:hypothetical protein
MKTARIAGICLALAGIALAGPQLRIGTKLTWRGDAGSSVWYDEHPAPIAEFSYGEQFGGGTIELSYGPIWGVSGRLDVAQVGFLFSGEVWRLFPLGVDLTFEPPTDWRAKPYAWAGGSFCDYANVSQTDFMPELTLLRAGLGARFDISRRVGLFAEAELLSSTSANKDGLVQFANGGDIRVVETKPPAFRLAGLELGARFALGK